MTHLSMRGAFLTSLLMRGTFNDISLDGRHKCSCNHCGPGLMCISGSILPVACPPGFFCTGSIASLTSTNTTQHESNSTCGTYSVANPCPGGTYNPLYSQIRDLSCLPCGEDFVRENSSLIGNDTSYRGYHCPNQNSSLQIKCPPGYFCLPRRAEPVECPAGE